MNQGIEARKSNIEGKGVFATRDFKKGEIIVKWDTSHKLTSEEADKLPEEEKRYVAYTGGKIFLQQPPARYVNHSCDPNTNVKDFCDVAIRDIKAGEEITSDYSADIGPDEVMECNCGRENCRKIITGKK